MPKSISQCIVYSVMEVFRINRSDYEEILLPRQRRQSDHYFKWLNNFFIIVLICIAGAFGIIGFTNIIDSGQARLLMDTSTSSNNSKDNEILLTVEHKQMIGKIMRSRDGRNYSTFLGIPYAKPPIGRLRFSPPEEVDPWEGVLDARNLRPQCIQLYKDKSTGNVSVVGLEDCLYLNIYTPKTVEDLSSGRNKLPVIFYIHGGINNGNASQYRADYMMDEDVVLVMVHYRLHVFGLLNTGDSVARGNFAIKDQVMALKWVQKNIVNFGGDKERVTIYGTSYGAMEVSVHLLSPMSKGLFHQAILESGTLLHAGIIVRDGRGVTNALANQVNCFRNNSEELLDCLRGIDAAVLTVAVRNLSFGHSIESKSDNPSEDTCLTDEPLKLLQSGQINYVPTIHGVASAEELNAAIGLLLSANDSSEVIPDENINQFLVENLILDYAKEPEAIVQSLRDFYFRPWNLTKDTLLQNFTNLLSDRNWVHPMKTYINYQLNVKDERKNPIYLYYFSRESNSSFASSAIERWGPSEVPFRVNHADCLQYFLPSKKFSRIDPGSSSYNFSKFAVKTWVNFATNGKPTRDDVEWTPLEPRRKASEAVSFKWYEFNENPKMFEPFGMKERLAKWDTFNLTDLYI